MTRSEMQHYPEIAAALACIGESLIHRDTEAFWTHLGVGIVLVLAVHFLHRWHFQQQRQQKREDEGAHEETVVQATTDSALRNRKGNASKSRNRHGNMHVELPSRKTESPTPPSQSSQNRRSPTASNSVSPSHPGAGARLQSQQRQALLKDKLDAGTITEEEYRALTVKDITGAEQDIDSGIDKDSERAPSLRSEKRRVLLQQKLVDGVITEREYHDLSRKDMWGCDMLQQQQQQTPPAQQKQERQKSRSASGSHWSKEGGVKAGGTPQGSAMKSKSKRRYFSRRRSGGGRGRGGAVLRSPEKMRARKEGADAGSNSNSPAFDSDARRVLLRRKLDQGKISQSEFDALTLKDATGWGLNEIVSGRVKEISKIEYDIESAISFLAKSDDEDEGGNGDGMALTSDDEEEWESGEEWEGEGGEEGGEGGGQMKDGEGVEDEDEGEGRGTAIPPGMAAAGGQQKRPTLVSIRKLDLNADTDSDAAAKGTSFKVRKGPNYKKNKKKAPSEPCCFECLGVDAWAAPDGKIDNISRFLELPPLPPDKKGGRVMVFNCQVPSYPPGNPLWSPTSDGPGISLCLYFAMPPVDTPSSGTFKAPDLWPEFCKVDTRFWDRLKAIGVIVNHTELKLSSLITRWNGKPVLTRPEHRFYEGDGYFEVDIDIHIFPYIARVGFNSVIGLAKNAVVDIGFVVEGRNDSELPERMLGAVRCIRLDPHTGAVPFWPEVQA